MEKNKLNLNKVAEDAGKGMKSLFGKAKDTIVKAVDQNDDGTFDKEDVSAIMESVSDTAKNTAVAVKQSLEEQRKELEKRTLQPIFVEDLDNAEFYLPKLIRLTEIDKKRSESEVCKGSIGYTSTEKDLKIVHIFKNHLDHFDLTLVPDDDSEVYYVDPTDRNRYIALEEYFNHLKVARINELQKIAQDLGAKHFKVTYKEYSASLSSSKIKAKAAAKFGKDGGNASIDHDYSSKDISNLGIVAESNFKGQDPVKPELCYLQKDNTIKSLIDMRMNETSPLNHQKLKIELSNTSGIKAKDAAKIDAALKSMKISGDTTISSEVQSESRRFFEYEVIF